MSASDTHISCASLAFSWPDGSEVFTGFDLTVGPGRTGLIGLNGCGKSTLLRLIAGELAPQEGVITVRGELGYLPQTLVLDTALRVDEVLGVADRRAALDAVESGDVRDGHFEVIGDDWDIEERSLATLDGLGLGQIGLDRTIGEMSGGECVLLRLAALLLDRPGVLLLDEPTNNLDAYARRRLYDAVDAWTGALLVVSHDRELLERVDRIADLREGSVTWYGGNLSAYEEALAVEQEAAQRMVRAAESDVQRQKRELSAAHVTLARRKRYGQKMWDTKREPKVVMGQRKRAAQVSAGKHRILHTERLAAAEERLDEAESAVREDEEIRIELPGTRVHPGGEVLLLRDPVPPYGPSLRGELMVRGPERIALTGRNGAGKTALLRTIAGDLTPLSGRRAPWSRRGSCRSGWMYWTTRRRWCGTWPGRRPAARTTPSGHGWPASCSRGRRRTARRGPCRAGRGSGRRWRRCCWPTPHPGCCCSTSRRTASIWRAYGG